MAEEYLDVILIFKRVMNIVNRRDEGQPDRELK